MRYINRKSGVSIDLGDLDAARKRLYETAVEQFQKNASWFGFERFVFSYTSPLFSAARNRADVIDDPLYAALKDMWLQLGINQGFVADDRNETQARTSSAHRPSVIRDVAPSRESPPPRRRRR
jgi:hypothetical protein